MTRLPALALVLAGSVAHAQTPPAAPPMNLTVPPAQPTQPVAAIDANKPVGLAALDPALAGHLKSWEARQKQITSLHAECDLKRIDTLARKEKAYTGLVMCMKPNLVWSQIKLKTNPADYEAYIGDGQSLYAYEADRKTVTEHKMPKPGAVDGNLMLEFLSGSMTAAQVADRFDLKLIREEKYYIQIQVMPRRPKDLQEFDSMLLVLYTPQAAVDLKADLAYLPKIVRMVRANGNQQNIEEWTFSDKQKVNNPGVTKDAFKFQEPPPGWVKKQAPAGPGGK